MTFLNPAILWGLTAASVPILIHLFNLRKTRKMEFSTLMFLKEIQQSRYKKLKLKQLLVLLCRIAFIILLVLAFSRPFESGYLGFAGERARSSVLLILDDSFSMEARESSGSNFEIARQKLLETIGMLNDNDEVYFTTVSGLNQSKKKLIYKDLNELKDTIRNVKISDVSKNMNEVIYFANKILEQASNPHKEIFLFTDGQKNFIETRSTVTDTKYDEGTNFNVFLTGSRKGNNISIDTVNVLTRIFEKNKSIKIKCTITNHNEIAAENQNIILNCEGTKHNHDEKVIDIPENSSIDVEFSFLPDKSGYITGYIELPVNSITNDEVPNDNRMYFVVYIPESVNILLVSHTPTDVDYIKLALSSSEELINSLSIDTIKRNNSFFNIKQISDGDLVKEDLTKYDCVVFVNKQEFSDDESSMLSSYIQIGGGVVIYPGKDISINNYNGVLMQNIGLPPIGTFSSNNNQPDKFDKLDYQHPLLEDLFKETQIKSTTYTGESPQITQGLNLQTDKNSQAIIKLSDGRNFLVEYALGKGHVLLYAVSPDMIDSDFPKNNLFPILTVRGLLYLSNNNSIKAALTGEDYYLDFTGLNVKTAADTLKLVSTGSSNAVTLNYLPGSLLMIPGNLMSQNSIYVLKAGEKVIKEIPSLYKHTESDLTKLSTSEITEIMKKTYYTNANVIAPDMEVTATLSALRTGRELWQIFLTVSLIFLVLEYLISRSITSKKE